MKNNIIDATIRTLPIISEYSNRLKKSKLRNSNPNINVREYTLFNFSILSHPIFLNFILIHFIKIRILTYCNTLHDKILRIINSLSGTLVKNIESILF